MVAPRVEEGSSTPPEHETKLLTGVTGFDLAWKIKQQSVVVGSTLKADNQLNGTDEIDAAMTNFDVELARILDAELVTV